MKKIILVIPLLILAVFLFVNNSFQSKTLQTGKMANDKSSKESENGSAISVIATNLDTPWAIAFLPFDSAHGGPGSTAQFFVTERLGRIQLVSGNQTKLVATIGKVIEAGEGGLLGIVLHPDFPSNGYVYLYYTYDGSSGRTLNRVVRMRYSGGQLKDETIIVDAIPGNSNHNGGRIKFGPDGFLYITTGDAQNPTEAQNKNSLAGKILRVTDDGKIPGSNPFNNAVYSYGHRNPQGIAWDEKGQLWETEHGRSGLTSGLDEVNVIQPGGNYGWEIIQGDQTHLGMITPVRNSGNDTWAPAGAAISGSSFFFGGLRGQALYEAIINNGQVVDFREHFRREFGRIREVILGPDKMLYITTSNQDGRGNPKEGDDKVIRVNPSKL